MPYLRKQPLQENVCNLNIRRKHLQLADTREPVAVEYFLKIPSDPHNGHLPFLTLATLGLGVDVEAMPNEINQGAEIGIS